MAQTIRSGANNFTFRAWASSSTRSTRHVNSFMEQARTFFLPADRRYSRAQQMALQAARRPAAAAGLIAGLLRRLLAVRVLGLTLVLLVPLMKRSVAEKGAHVAAE